MRRKRRGFFEALREAGVLLGTGGGAGGGVSF